jgi:Ca2+-binding EF-hand superfamily protein
MTSRNLLHRRNISDCMDGPNPAEDELAEQTQQLFDVIDVNKDGWVTKDEFVIGLLNAPHLDINNAEATRLFDSVDFNKSGYVNEAQFLNVSNYT